MCLIGKYKTLRSNKQSGVGYKIVTKTKKGFRSSVFLKYYQKNTWYKCKDASYSKDSGFYIYLDINETLERLRSHSKEAVIVAVEYKNIKYIGQNDDLSFSKCVVARYIRIISEVSPAVLDFLRETKDES